MKKFIIKDFYSLNNYLKSIDNHIFGVGTRPYNYTIGIRDLFRNFEILSCNKIGEERHSMEKKIKITYLNSKDEFGQNVENYKRYVKKNPSDLFKNKKILNYLKSFESKPVILFGKMSKETDKVSNNSNFTWVSSGFRMFNKYENKINFQKLLDRLNIISPKHILINAKKIEYEFIKEKIGKEFVIQIPNTDLGAGTFFIFKKSDFDKIIKKEILKQAVDENVDLKITEYIHKSCSPSMTVCVSKFGILYTGLQRQIIDAEEVMEIGRRSGVFCGHDWDTGMIDPMVQKKAFEIAEKIGKYFKDKENFKGIFGIDFVLDKKKNRLYPIEANVRLLGSFPIVSMMQESFSQPSIQALQILENLNKSNYILDVKALNRSMSKPKHGAHVNIYSRIRDSVYVSGIIKPGIYEIDLMQRKVKYLREGVFFDDLKNKNEILLTGGVPSRGRVFERHGNICKLVSKNSFLKNDDKLNDFAKLMIKYVYKSLKLKKIVEK